MYTLLSPVVVVNGNGIFQSLTINLLSLIVSTMASWLSVTHVTHCKWAIKSKCSSCKYPWPQTSHSPNSIALTNAENSPLVPSSHLPLHTRIFALLPASSVGCHKCVQMHRSLGRPWIQGQTPHTYKGHTIKETENASMLHSHVLFVTGTNKQNC